MSTGSITLWLRKLESEPEPAARALWGHFFARMTALARQRLAGGPRGAADEEDVALAAFERFHRAALAGRFPRLRDRDDLWRVLFRLTANAARDQLRAEEAAKRGGGEVLGGSALDDAAAEGPTPEEAAQMSEGLARLLAALPDDDARRIATARMEGYENAEIAAELGCSLATVERRAKMIRAVWQRLAEAEKSSRG
jgi:RNA polymerase sigma factor (sigma-70 family)